MTTKAAFSPEEWNVVLEGPPSAGMIVVTAARGGMFRETVAMSKAYAEARAQHGESELLDEIVSAKPELDHTRYHSADELRDHGLAHLRDAVALPRGQGEPRGTRRLPALRPHPRQQGRGRPPRGRAGRQSRGGGGRPADRGGAGHGRFLTGSTAPGRVTVCHAVTASDPPVWGDPARVMAV